MSTRSRSKWTPEEVARHIERSRLWKREEREERTRQERAAGDCMDAETWNAMWAEERALFPLE